MRSFLLPIAVALLALIHACAGIEPIAEGECGNAVIEQGGEQAEDCDTFAVLEMPCRPAGDDGECRFDCTSTGVCAPAFGCGEDSICRAPLGQLVPAAVITDGAELLNPGDFDGDGVVDLLGGLARNATLSYLGSDFEEEDTQDLTFDFGATPVAVGHLTDDELDDVVFADPFGVAVARGTDARLLEGTAYPSFTAPIKQSVVFTAHVEPNTAARESFTLVDDFRGGTGAYRGQVLKIDLTVASPEPTLQLTDTGVLPNLEVGAGRSLDRVPVGRLDPNMPCDQYVLAFRYPDEGPRVPARDRVFLGTLCTRDGMLNGTDPPPGGAPVTVESPVLSVNLTQCASQLVDSAFVVDVNTDGALDVVIAPPGPADTEPCVANGPFTFADPDTMIASVPVVAQPYPLFMLMAEEIQGQAPVTERVLDVTHLSSDTVPDLVTTYGIFLSQASPCPSDTSHATSQINVHHCRTAPAGADPDYGQYLSAAVGDVNGNGVADVAVARQQGGHVLLFSGYADGTFSRYLVDADGFPDNVALGDFDGDGLDDLAFADRACRSPAECVLEARDHLAVAFGRVSGGPEEARGIGSLGEIQQLEAAKLASEGSVDASEDLAVLGKDTLGDEDPVNDLLNFALLRGNTRRELQAPLVLSIQGATTQGDAVYVPVGVALGHFAEGQPGGYEPQATAATGRSDLAVAAICSEPGDCPELEVRLWLLASEGEAELAQSRAWPSEPIGGWGDHDPFAGFMAAADLDADPAHEVVYVSGTRLVIGDPQRGATGPVFVPTVLELNTTSVYSSLAATSPVASLPIFDNVVPQPGAAGAIPVPLLLRDVDGDGKNDIVLLGRTETGTGTAGRLLVLWNSEGGFDPVKNASTLDFVGETTAFVALHFDDEPSLEILVADGDGLTLVQVNGRELVAAGAPPGLRADLAPVLAMASADFDKDGVPDLALGHKASITLYRSLPRNE